MPSSFEFTVAGSLILFACIGKVACLLPAPASASTAEPPSTQAAASSYELQVLSQLGWQSYYDPSGYSVVTELPSNITSNTWHSLGCLQSLTNLTLTGSLPDLPDSWAANGSFPALQVMNFSLASLAGSLPSIWAQDTAFPQLQTMNLSMTQLSGTLPTAWRQRGAFPSLLALYLHQTNITGLLFRTTPSASLYCICASTVQPLVVC